VMELRNASGPRVLLGVAIGPSKDVFNLLSSSLEIEVDFLAENTPSWLLAGCASLRG
jgi:hypothetical protein